VFKYALAALASALLGSASFGANLLEPSIDQIFASLKTSLDGDGYRAEVGPRWSQTFGFGAEVRAGLLLSEALALGLVVSLGEKERELVLNGAINLGKDTILIGTLAGHEQSRPNGDLHNWMRQLEAGISLRRDTGTGFFAGYEINAFTTQSSPRDVGVGALLGGETAGFEGNLLLHPVPGMTARLGLGYEKIVWEDGFDGAEGWTTNVKITQVASDRMALSLGAQLGQIETRYSAAINLDPNIGAGVHSGFGLEYSYRAGRDGSAPDHRLIAYWRVGGADTARPLQVLRSTDSASSAEPVRNRNDLLASVMTKPEFLPSSVLSKEQSGACTLESAIVDPTRIYANAFDNYSQYSDIDGRDIFEFLTPEPPGTEYIGLPSSNWTFYLNSSSMPMDTTNAFLSYDAGDYILTWGDDNSLFTVGDTITVLGVIKGVCYKAVSGPAFAP
jgi:hypothetical protein